MTNTTLIKFFLASLCSLSTLPSFAADNDACGKDGHGTTCEAKEKKADEHGKENPAVGEDKGILAVNDKDGFRLAESAVKTFGLKLMTVSSQGSMRVPVTAIYYGLQEMNIYRVRNGFYKRVDFQLVQKSTDSFTVSSKDLASGDQIVVSGVPFLRIAELQAYGGVADEH